MPEQHPSGLELSSLVDGALPARRGAALEAHLRACGRCLGVLEAMRATKAAVAGLPATEPRPEWLPRVEEVLARGVAGHPGGRRSRRVRVGAGIAVAAAGAGLALWLVPPAAAPATFQEEVRQHLAQMDNPVSDQASYVVETRYP